MKGRCCTLRPTPVTKRNGTLPPAKIMRRFSQLRHGSLVPCVVQLCASRIRGDRSCRLRCCWRRKCYPSPPLYTKPSVWCVMGGRILSVALFLLAGCGLSSKTRKMRGLSRLGVSGHSWWTTHKAASSRCLLSIAILHDMVVILDAKVAVSHTPYKTKLARLRTSLFSRLSLPSMWQALLCYVAIATLSSTTPFFDTPAVRPRQS